MSGIQMMLLGSAADDPATITISDQNITGLASPPDTAYAYYFLTSGGQVEQSTEAGGINPSNIEQWCTPTSAVSSYEARVTINSGSLTGGSGAGTWLPLSSTRNWYVSESVSSSTNICEFLVEIRLASTGVVKDSATITLEAQVF
jgi:hypothetical protein